MHLVFKSQSTTRFSMQSNSPISLLRYLLPKQLPLAVCLHVAYRHANTTIVHRPVSNVFIDLLLREACMWVFHVSVLFSFAPPRSTIVNNSFSVPTLSFLTMLTRLRSIYFLTWLFSLADGAILSFVSSTCKSVSAPLQELKLAELN